MTADIAWQPRMGRRMDYLGADAIAGAEASRGDSVALGRSAPVQHAGDVLGREGFRNLLCGMQRLAGFDLS